MDTVFYIVALPKRKFCYIKTDNQEDQENKIGYRAIVELENDKSVGIIIGKARRTKEWEIAQKYEIPDEIPLLPQNMIELSKKIAEKYFCDIFDVLKIMCPPRYFELEVKLKNKREKERDKNKNEKKNKEEYSKEVDSEEFEENGKEGEEWDTKNKTLKKSEKKFLELLKEKKKITLSRAKKILKIKRILELENLGLIKITISKKQKSKEDVEKELKKIREKKEEDKIYDQQKERVKLSEEQQKALEEILNNEGKFLIHGVTGSGKTKYI